MRGDDIPALLARGVVTMRAPNNFFIRTFGVLLVRRDFRKLFRNIFIFPCLKQEGHAERIRKPFLCGQTTNVCIYTVPC